MTTPYSFDQVRILSESLGRSPLSWGNDASSLRHRSAVAAARLSDESLLQVFDEIQLHTKALCKELPVLRSFAGRWILKSEDEYYDSEFVRAPYRSVVSVLAEGGLPLFTSLFDLETQEDCSVLQEYFTDVVRVEWEFAQLLMDKPEHIESYKSQLREAYSRIVDQMKKDFPYLPWSSRLQVGDALAA